MLFDYFLNIITLYPSFNSNPFLKNLLYLNSEIKFRMETIISYLKQTKFDGT